MKDKTGNNPIFLTRNSTKPFFDLVRRNKLSMLEQIDTEIFTAWNILLLQHLAIIPYF